MIKRIDTKSGKTISYVYNLKDEDYRIVSERLEMDEEKIKNVIDEEIFTPRISKSDWEIYKLYYPTVKKPMIDKEVTSYEINPIVICMRENKVVILDDDYFEDFYDFVEEYAELRDDVLEENRFFLNMLHKISQSLYKYVRLLIGEHDNIETEFWDIEFFCHKKSGKYIDLRYLQQITEIEVFLEFVNWLESL